MDHLDEIVEKIRAALSEKNEAREKALQLSREVIRHCADSIRAVHRGEKERAEALQEAARGLLGEASQGLEEHGDLYHAGYLRDAQKEYVEARVTLAAVFRGQWPDPDEMGVGYAAYLNGVGEAMGELRRCILDSLRRGEMQAAEELLGVMDDVYDALVTFDFPDALTGGLRRTTDMVRGVLERTRGDVTVAFRQQYLEAHLQRLEDRLSEEKEKSSTEEQGCS